MFVNTTQEHQVGNADTYNLMPACVSCFSM